MSWDGQVKDFVRRVSRVSISGSGSETDGERESEAMRFATRGCH
jgi:hypothetical protein